MWISVLSTDSCSVWVVFPDGENPEQANLKRCVQIMSLISCISIFCDVSLHSAYSVINNKKHRLSGGWELKFKHRQMVKFFSLLCSRIVLSSKQLQKEESYIWNLHQRRRVSVCTGEKCNPHYCADAHLHHCGDMLSYSQRSVPLIEVEHLMYKDVFFGKKKKYRKLL